MSLVVDIFLSLAVLAAWIAAAGLARLSYALDRLHAVAFATIGCGLPVVLAAFAADGPSTRAFKLLLLVVVSVVAGASVNQALARAVFTRAEAGERS